MIISSILAVVVFAVMFIMAARDKLSRPAVMGMSAVGAVLLLFGAFIGLSRSDDQMLIAQIAAVLIFVVMFVLIIMDKIERHIVTLCCGLATLVMVFGICLRSFDAVSRTYSRLASGTQQALQRKAPAVSTGRPSSLLQE